MRTQVQILLKYFDIGHRLPDQKPAFVLYIAVRPVPLGPLR
jgi:hypothetical protein